MRLFSASLITSLVGYVGAWLLFATVLGIEPSPALLLFAAWLAVPYLPCVAGAWFVRSHPLPGIFALAACIGTAVRGLSVPIAMMSQRRDAQDGLILIFLPLLQLPVAGGLLLLTAVVAVIGWRREASSTLPAINE